MWQQEKKDSSIVSLALLLALATIPTTATTFKLRPVLAQSPVETPAFPLPQSVANGTVVKIDGAKTLAAINQGIKQSFEQQFAGTKVELASNGSDAALQALLDGNVDVVALSRGLTPEEKGKGLEQVRLRREKIAVFVSASNPFKGNLTSKQFARIFRGEITNWSELGGDKGEIRVIDHPTTSDTRNNLRSQPAFKTAKFATGANATQLADDNTAAIIAQLGKDGISYALASQVSELAKLQNIRVINIDDLAPDDSKYPFSQPLVYVYKTNPAPGVAAVLGLAIASPGQKAIDAARLAEANNLSANQLQALPPNNPTLPVTEATTAPTPESFTQVNTESSPVPSQPPATTPSQSTPSSVNPALFLWLLLPVVGVFLLWWFLGRSASTTEDAENNDSTAPTPEENNAADVDASTVPTAASQAINPAPSHLTEPVVITTPDVSEAAWEIETPATVVSNSYPQLPDVPVVAPEPELPTATINSSASPISNIPEVSLDTDVWSDDATPAITATPPVIEAETREENYAIANTAAATEEIIWSDISDSQPSIAEPVVTASDSPQLPELSLDIESPPTEVANNTSAMSDLPEVELNAVADAAEWSGDFVEEEAVEIVPDTAAPTNPVTSDANGVADLTNAASLTAAAGIGTWAGIYGIENTEESPPAPASPLVIAATDTYTEATIEIAVKSAEWVYVSWYIPEAEKHSPLLLRLYDVTGIDLSYQTPQLIQTYEIGELLKDRLIPVPATEHDYITEIGYVADGNWRLIARSAIAHVFNPLYHDEATADTPATNTTAKIIFTPLSSEAAEISWQIPPAQQTTLKNAGVSEIALRLYDVTGMDLSYQTPQLVQAYAAEAFINSRHIPIPHTERDYITEIGYVVDGRWVLIARSEIVRFFSPLPADTSQATAKIILKPESSEWAYVSWQIPPEQRQGLEHAGITHLQLRLSDVTGLDMSYQQPQLLEEYDIEGLIKDRFVPIPMTERDYITEIGYVKDGEWVLIARSAIARFFSPIPEDTDIPAASITLKFQSHEWADVTWEIPPQQQQGLENAGISQVTLRLYDVTGIDLSYQSPHLVEEYPQAAFSQNRALAIPHSERDYITEIGYLRDGNWVSIARSEVVHFFNPIPAKTENTQASIILKPHTPKWAYVSWQIPHQQQQALQNLELSQLTLRLYDVTGVVATEQNHDLVQEYEIEILIKDRFVGIPATERDYITEIGYVQDNQWTLIARSSPVHISSQTPTDTPTTPLPDENTEARIILTPRTPKWAYVSWEIPATQKTALQHAGVANLALRLYDTTSLDLSYQTPQLVQQYGCEEVTSDRFVAIPTTDRDYIIEIGYIAEGDRWVPIARSSSVRIFSRPQTEFWFVADAELIIHGATQPNATVTVGSHNIKLKPDGTFHLRIPFSEDIIEYLLTATAANGQEVKTISQKFSQENPPTS